MLTKLLCREPGTDPNSEVFQLIKNEEHVYIEWKSKLEVMMKEQYNITRQVKLEKNENFKEKKTN